MAIDAGDVVITFLGDTTQLDSAFATVAGRSAELNETAAMSTVQLTQAQAALRAALAAVTAEGGNTLINMEALAAAEEQLTVAALAAKEAHAALSAELVNTAETGGVLSGVMGELAGSLTGALLAFTAFEAVKSMMEGVQESVLQLGLLAQKTGIAIQTLAGLEYAAKATGVSFDTIGASLTRLGRAQTLALEGTKAQIAAFDRIGISVQELKTLSPEDLFYRVGQGLDEAKSRGEAAATAITLFGKGGAALIPIFSEGADALHKLVDEAGAASNVTEKADAAARNWQVQLALLADGLRSTLIPIMEGLLPVFRAVETAGSVLWQSLVTVGIGLAGMFDAIYSHGVEVLKVIGDVIRGDFATAIVDAQTAGTKIAATMKNTGSIISQNWQEETAHLKAIWKDVDPLKPPQDDLSGIKNRSKDATAALIQDAKLASDAIIAQIELRKAQQKLLYDQGKINAEQWAQEETKAAYEARDAHLQYLQAVVDIYTKAGNAQKAKHAQDELDVATVKSGTAALTEYDKATQDLTKENAVLAKTMATMWKDAQKDIAKVSDIAKEPILTPLMQNVLLLNADLKKLGVEGWGPLQAKLDLVEKAEARLNQMGISSGKVWLEVQQAKLKAIIAVEEAEGRSATKEIHDLQAVEHQLKEFGQKLKDEVPTIVEMQQKMAQSMGQFASDMGTAFAAVIQGQLSMAQAVEQSVGKLIANIAKHWADYFIALAIGNMFTSPALAAEELAAAAALSMLGSLAGSLGGSSAKTSGSSVTIAASPATTAGGAGTSSANMPHFQEGGLITAPTMAMMGEGRQAEGVIPLGNAQALDMIGKAIASHLPQTGQHSVTVTLETDISQTIKRINNAVNTGGARLRSTDSMRLTRRSV